MNKSSKFKFILGILTVFLIVGMLFLYLNYTMSRAVSRAAELDANTFTVGVDYSGIIEKQYVEEGAQVKKGDSLFEIRSSALAEGLSADKVDVESLNFDVTNDNNILLKATGDGVVRKINFHQGAFVSANSELAVINQLGSLYVTATYKLAPPDYARIKKGSEVIVTLPDNKKITAKVFDISLVSRGTAVDTVVKARINQTDTAGFTFATGTPVETVLFFDNDSWYQLISQKVQALFEPNR